MRWARAGEWVARLDPSLPPALRLKGIPRACPILSSLEVILLGACRVGEGQVVQRGLSSICDVPWKEGTVSLAPARAHTACSHTPLTCRGR